MRRIEDLPLVLAGRIVLLGIDEQGTAEQVVPGGFGFHDHRQVVLEAGTHVYTRSVAGTFGQVVLHPGPQGIELVSRERAVDGTPGDIGTGGRLIDDETVHGRTAGTLTSLHDQSSGIGQLTLIALDRRLDQLGDAQVVKYGIGCLRHQT